jgi:hypothetical protein
MFLLDANVLIALGDADHAPRSGHALLWQARGNRRLGDLSAD